MRFNIRNLIFCLLLTVVFISCNTDQSDDHNHSFSSQWETDENYSITYKNVQNATFEPVSNYSITQNIVLNSPAKTEYFFAGWYSDSSFNTKVENSWNAGDRSGNLILYAKWLPTKIKSVNSYKLEISNSEISPYVGLSGKLRLVVENRNNHEDRLTFMYGTKSGHTISNVATEIICGSIVTRYTTVLEMDDVTIDSESEFKIYRELYYNSSGWQFDSNNTSLILTLYFE